MNALSPVALKLCRVCRQGWLLREGSSRVPVRLVELWSPCEPVWEPPPLSGFS